VPHLPSLSFERVNSAYHETPYTRRVGTSSHRSFNKSRDSALHTCSNILRPVRDLVMDPPLSTQVNCTSTVSTLLFPHHPRIWGNDSRYDMIPANHEASPPLP
jgi:hypothetical protein